jgi:type III secretion translocon protein HrpF
LHEALALWLLLKLKLEEIAMSNTITGTGATTAVLGGLPAGNDPVQGGIGLGASVDHALAKMMSFKADTKEKIVAAKTEAANAHALPAIPARTSPVPPLAVPTKPTAPATMSESAIEAHCRDLLPANNDEIPGKLGQIQREIENPKTSPEMKNALQQLKTAITGDGVPVLNAAQTEALATLQRHRGGDFSTNLGDLQKRIDDPSTPPDLKKALGQIKNDPTFKLMLDTGRDGGGFRNCDGTVSNQDIDKLSQSPAMVKYDEQQAVVFAQNYIPSDADPSVKGVRAITENDAMRELYRYSDYLPGTLNEKELKKIVDGQGHGMKCPPQVIAAAQFMLGHPKSWSKITQDVGGKPSLDGSVARSTMLDNIGKDIYLTKDETSTIDTLDKNRKIFFNGDMSRDSLKKLSTDPKSSPEVVKAAKKLLDDPVLLGMLDNASAGHSYGSNKTADDGIICEHDLNDFMKKSKTKGKPQLTLPPTHPATSALALQAMADMKAGELDKPEEKKKKGQLKGDIFKKMASLFLKIAAGYEHFLSIALSALSKIPIIGELAAPLAMATEALAGGLDIANAAVQGKDVKKAAEMAALGIAGAAISIAVAPGAGAAVMKGVETVAMKVGTQAAVAGTEKGVVVGAEKVAITATEKAAATTGAKGTEKVAEGTASQGSKAVGKQETAAEAKTEAKKEANDELKKDAANTASDQANANHQQNGLVDTGAMFAGVQATRMAISLEERTRQQESLDRQREAKMKAEENLVGSSGQTRTVTSGGANNADLGTTATTSTVPAMTAGIKAA